MKLDFLFALSNETQMALVFIVCVIAGFWIYSKWFSASKYPAARMKLFPCLCDGVAYLGVEIIFQVSKQAAHYNEILFDCPVKVFNAAENSGYYKRECNLNLCPGNETTNPIKCSVNVPSYKEGDGPMLVFFIEPAADFDILKIKIKSHSFLTPSIRLQEKIGAKADKH